ncbi:MAG: 50S ribosomal protein L18 [Planctomycetes bacterium]|nr:50S ribosomal protein L18 [Planctomycetota bacterium]MCB9910379.1 50S ribosomal protein L18 [Planctomycetota bacterium]MCB9912010.1 50S ribosomal protein L18 [Planctomycetota bacterium]HPF14230.1 50S ribosomal protein L18 [Planctomycetota bacterium]HRV79958.1 50S ribosomal protein L18 [Planctomycetota bacterium]
MKATIALKNERRKRRAAHVRRLIRERSTLPRLSVHRSSKHISVQVVDDVQGHTLASATSTAKTVQAEMKGKTKSDTARFIGAEIARKALEAGVTKVVLDRGFSRYQGRVKALADAAREAGLKF